jgi:molybdopterin/thiamine biosynthesis adenylyltransferase
MNRPRVKRAHDPIRFSGGRIRIGSVQYGVGSEIADETGLVWRALQLMDGSRTPAEIVASLGQDGLAGPAAESLVADLCASGFVEDAAATPDPRLADTARDRYSRNEGFFSWVDTTPREHTFELQAALASSRVAVLGLGGSGAHVASSLARVGVGYLRCVDFDVIEPSNLNRQVLYEEGDVGSPKVERAVARLRSINSDIEVEGIEQLIDSVAAARRAIEGVDLAILCADVPHPDVQLWTNDAAHELGVTWSVCFYAGPTLMTGIFVPGATPCYRCLLDSGPSPLRAESGETGVALYGATDINGVIAPTAGIAGQFGALEAIYHLAGLNPQTVGRLFHQNLMVYDHNYFVTPEAQTNCPQCSHLARA